MAIDTLYQLYLQYPLILTDTRKIEKNGIFFALKGGNFDGNTFAAQALAAGAAYAVIDNAAYAHGDRCILVNNVLETLQQLANHHRRQLNIPFIAITGSNGKTTTKELITAVLRQKFVTYATPGNLNNHIGVPLTLLKIRQNAQIAVVEMGANHIGEIAGYCVIAEPGYGLITNCGKAHIEGFGSELGVRKGKGELYDWLRANGGTAFRNTGLEYLEEMATGITHQVTYGTANAHYTGRPIMNGAFLQAAVHHAGNEIMISTQLVGAYNFPNVMAAVSIGMHFGVPMEQIKQAIETYEPDNSRSQWVTRASNRIILDAYNANPSSMQAAITNFAASGLENKILWLGGMKEMGQEEQNEHRALINLISSHTWADVILVGSEFAGIRHTFKWFATSAEAATYVNTHQPHHASILIKGSRGSKMEVMAEALDTGT